jgi:hypothetical protein
MITATRWVWTKGEPSAMTDRRDGWCLFECAHFQQAAVFLSSAFHGPVTLAGSVSDKSVDLRHTVFRGDLDLRCTFVLAPAR